ncbi:MAG: hypothetical protein U5O39_02265 [Gammaproteobacteria bacterium]|nr:hypothetical protein [Gammaproteobacteria bacterium]
MGPGRVFEIAAADMGKAGALDARADIVEDGGPDQGGAGDGQRHGDEPAARGADEGRAFDAQHGTSPAAISSASTSTR